MGLGSFFSKNKDKKKVTAECHIEITKDNCDGCEKCSTACPNNVLVLSGDKMAVRDSQVCKSCRVCVAICPNDSITVN